MQLLQAVEWRKKNQPFWNVFSGIALLGWVVHIQRSCTPSFCGGAAKQKRKDPRILRRREGAISFRKEEGARITRRIQATLFKGIDQNRCHLLYILCRFISLVIDHLEHWNIAKALQVETILFSMKLMNAVQLVAANIANNVLQVHWPKGARLLPISILSLFLCTLKGCFHGFFRLILLCLHVMVK